MTFLLVKVKFSVRLLVST